MPYICTLVIGYGSPFVNLPQETLKSEIRLGKSVSENFDAEICLLEKLNLIWRVNTLDEKAWV